ncbi:RRXRR domain-containing protein, partial [Phormidium sp. CCY1219]|uniref:RRXRR domain-containing protein n=1 Tax=Phormidium sp. CCY1219 TaxID=2886104 RepID=UPI002D1F7077
FNNRKRPQGWLAPSLQHRVLTTLTWINRLKRFCPISAISMELVRFDTQLIQNPEISGVEYQQGELVGYEVREYLL